MTVEESEVGERQHSKTVVLKKPREQIMPKLLRRGTDSDRSHVQRAFPILFSKDLHGDL